MWVNALDAALSDTTSCTWSVMPVAISACNVQMCERVHMRGAHALVSSPCSTLRQIEASILGMPINSPRPGVESARQSGTQRVHTCCPLRYCPVRYCGHGGKLRRARTSVSPGGSPSRSTIGVVDGVIVFSDTHVAHVAPGNLLMLHV